MSMTAYPNGAIYRIGLLSKRQGYWLGPSDWTTICEKELTPLQLPVANSDDGGTV